MWVSFFTPFKCQSQHIWIRPCRAEWEYTSPTVGTMFSCHTMLRFRLVICEQQVHPAQVSTAPLLFWSLSHCPRQARSATAAARRRSDSESANFYWRHAYHNVTRGEWHVSIRFYLSEAQKFLFLNQKNKWGSFCGMQNSAVVCKSLRLIFNTLLFLYWTLECSISSPPPPKIQGQDQCCPQNNSKKRGGGGFPAPGEVKMKSTCFLVLLCLFGSFACFITLHADDEEMWVYCIFFS